MSTHGGRSPGFSSGFGGCLGIGLLADHEAFAARILAFSYRGS